MILAFIVEDEPPALRKIKRLLEAEQDLVCCGYATSCTTAISEIRRSHPNLLLLDIRLPDGSGFDVLKGIRDLSGIQVIFLTALGTHAIEAFEVAAIDYLVKPVAQRRFSEAIQCARERSQNTNTAKLPIHTKRFLVEWRRLMYLLPVDCVEWIGADRNYARQQSNITPVRLYTNFLDCIQSHDGTSAHPRE